MIELKKELTQTQDAKNATDKKLENEKQQNEDLGKQIITLKETLENVKNSTEASDKIQKEVAKARNELESEKKCIN